MGRTRRLANHGRRMACGVPVISFDSGSLPEVVRDAGILVREADSEELSNAINRIQTEPGLKENLITAGLCLVKEKYEWSRIADQMYQLYRQIRMIRTGLDRNG